MVLTNGPHKESQLKDDIVTGHIYGLASSLQNVVRSDNEDGEVSILSNFDKTGKGVFRRLEDAIRPQLGDEIIVRQTELNSLCNG